MVVAIIGILATLIVVSLMGVQKKARDTKIMSAAKDTANGVYQYQLDLQHYPIASELGVTDAELVSGVVVQDTNSSNPSLRRKLVSNYVSTDSIYSIPAALVAKYTATIDGSKFAIAWPLEATQSKFNTSGNGVYRNYNGQVTVPNMIGQAVSWSGVAQQRITYTAAGSDGVFNFGSNVYSGKQITLSAWFNSSSNCVSATVNSCGIVGYYHGSNFRSPSIILKDNGTRIEAGVGSDIGEWYPLSSGANSISLNTWYNVVLRYQGALRKADLFLNGTQVATIANAPFQIQSSSLSSYYVGSVIDNANNTFVGLIDDVRLYNTYLSNSDITTMYNNGAGTPSLNNVSGLVCYWKYDTSSANSSTNTFTPSSCPATEASHTPSQALSYPDGKVSSVIFSGIAVPNTTPNGAFLTLGP